MLRRHQALTLLIVLAAWLPASLGGAELVPGVWVNASDPPVPTIMIVAPQPDHNVVSVGVDAATACYRITVNGLTAEVPEATASVVNYYGSAGGSDQVSYAGAGGTVTLFWGNNTLTASAMAGVSAYLYGDDNSAAATGGATITYDTWGGPHDTFTGTCTRGYPDAYYQATSLTGVFVTFPAIVNIVSPVAQGNVLSVAYDSATETVTVTENGVAVAIAGGLTGFNYFGSWNGADAVTGVSCDSAILYGSGNHLTIDQSLASVVLDGSGNTVTSTDGSGEVWLFGTDETVSGLTVEARGPAPTEPTVYTGGTGSPPTVATPAAVSPSPVTGKTAALSVLGADAGGEASLTYTWTVTSANTASFSVNDSNAAKDTTVTFGQIGTYTFAATIRNAENLIATSSVTTTVNATPSSLTLTPTDTSVAAGGTLPFSATVNDQFGAALVTQPSVTWAVSGGGSIDANGLFSAGATPGGPYTVTASAGGLRATTQLTITSGASTTGTTTTSSGTTTTSGTATATAGASTGSSGGGGGGGCGVGGGLGLLLLGVLGSRTRRASPRREPRPGEERLT